MGTNPYSPPVAPIERQPFRSRLVSILDIAAFICAGLPLAYFAGVIVFFRASPRDSLSDREAIVLTSLLLAFGCLWLIAGGYNLTGVVRKRQLPLMGIVLNIISLLLWGGLFAMFARS